MRLESRAVVSVSRPLAFAVAMLLVVSTVASFGDTRHHEQAGTSTVISGSAPVYASDGLAFAQMDDDGSEELVTVELAPGFPRAAVATISSWADGTWTLEWQSEQVRRLRSMLVGNIDEDDMEEFVLFGEWNYAGKDTVQVVQWDGSSYRATGSDRLSGRLGALGDIDADGRQELVLVHVPDPAAEAEGTEPAMLQVAKYRSGGFERILDYDIGFGVMAIAAGDLDGDGRAEIATWEVSDGGIGGRIVVYAIDRDRGIERVFTRNGSARGLSYLGVFRSGDANYLFAEQRNREHWKSAFELVGSRDKGFELVAVKADRVRVFADGLRSTMAYSTERGAYARFRDQTTIEFVRE